MSTKTVKPSAVVPSAAAVTDPASPHALPQQALDALFALLSALRGHMRQNLQEPPADDAPGLAPMHLRLLKYCLHNPGASQQALVQASGRDKGQIARLVKELDAQGLVVREADPDDGRSQRLNLTPAGRAACQRFHQQEAAIAQRLFQPMPAHEIQTLIDQLGALRERLHGAGDAPPGAHSGRSR